MQEIKINNTYTHADIRLCNSRFKTQNTNLIKLDSLTMDVRTLLNGSIWVIVGDFLKSSRINRKSDSQKLATH